MSVYVRIDKKELGTDENGNTVTVLGHVFGFETFNGIAVLLVEKPEQEPEICFAELSDDEQDLNQVTDELAAEELHQLWKATMQVDKMAEEMGLNDQELH